MSHTHITSAQLTWKLKRGGTKKNSRYQVLSNGKKKHDWTVSITNIHVLFCLFNDFCSVVLSCWTWKHTKTVNCLFWSLCLSPVPSMSWRRVDGVPFPRKVDMRKASGVLEIPYFQPEDSGTYECVAENSRGMNTVKGKLSYYGTWPCFAWIFDQCAAQLSDLLRQERQTCTLASLMLTHTREGGSLWRHIGMIKGRLPWCL